MSIEAMAIVLHHFPAIPDKVPGVAAVPNKQTIKLVALGIANHDGDGGAWPTVPTLAKYAECSRDTARRCVRVLEHVGMVVTHIREGGTARTPKDLRPNLYELQVTCPPGCDGSKEHRIRALSDTAIPASRADTPTEVSADPPLSTQQGLSSLLSGPPAERSAPNRPKNRPMPTLEPSDGRAIFETPDRARVREKPAEPRPNEPEREPVTLAVAEPLTEPHGNALAAAAMPVVRPCHPGYRPRPRRPWVDDGSGPEPERYRRPPRDTEQAES